MKRRSFLGLSGAAALSPVVNRLEEATGIPKSKSDSKKEIMEQIVNIAGYTPAELLDQYKGYLFDDFLPFMDKYIIDHQLGGFMCNTNRSGKNITTNKRLWFDGRGIWVYSFLYNNLKKDPSCFETARKTVDFVLKIRPDDKNLRPASYTKEGNVLTDYPVDIYGDLFLAEGLAEFSKACADKKYWDIAKEILINCQELYDREDFNYVIVDYGPKAPPVPAPRVVGCWMVLLRTSYCLLSQKQDT
jgi:N-acylglucosamine 2-epimerase